MSIDFARQGKVAIFTLNRPEVMNAVDNSTRQDLHEALAGFLKDERLKVGIITGAGERAFSSGVDLKEVRSLLKVHPHQVELPQSPFQGLEFDKPLIAAVNGVAIGGGLEIVMTCDIRITARHAVFGFPEGKLGIIPWWGGTQMLLRMIPYCKAAEMLLTGAFIDAAEAYRIGLVNKVVPLPELMPAAHQVAETICEMAPLMVKAAKEALTKGVNLDMKHGLELESGLFHKLLPTTDFAEGVNAFVEKRNPAFQGK